MCLAHSPTWIQPVELSGYTVTWCMELIGKVECQLRVSRHRLMSAVQYATLFVVSGVYIGAEGNEYMQGESMW